MLHNIKSASIRHILFFPMALLWLATMISCGRGGGIIPDPLKNPFEVKLALSIVQRQAIAVEKSINGTPMFSNFLRLGKTLRQTPPAGRNP